MKNIGKLMLCALPLMGMLMINVLVSIVGTVIMSVYYAISGITDPEELLNLLMEPTFLMTVTVIYQFITLIIAFFVYRYAIKKEKFKKLTESVTILNGLFIVVLFIGIEFLISEFLNGVDILFPTALDKYEELMSQMGLEEFSLLTVFATIILAPLSEEFVFRGITFNIARRFTKNFWIANSVQALMFGIAHLNLVQGIYAFCLGLVLGWIYKKYNSLYATILAHLVFNFAGTILVSLIFGEETSNMILVITLIGAIVLTAIGILLIIRDKKCKENEILYFEESDKLFLAATLKATEKVEAYEAKEAESVEENKEENIE